MNKIPVGKTIADAYAFAFGGFLSNLGIVWLPVVLALAAAAFLLMPYLAAVLQVFQNIQPGAKPDPLAMMGPLMATYRWVLLFYFVDIAFRAMMMLGLTRRALGIATGAQFVFFSVGRPFWRIFGAYLVMALIILVIYLIGFLALMVMSLVLIGVGAGAAASAGASAVAGGAAAVLAVLLGVVLTLGFYGAMLYIVVRMTFLLTPSILVEDKTFSVLRSWELTKGNFWRIFAVGFAIFVPMILVIDTIVFCVIVGPVWSSLHVHLGDPQAGFIVTRAIMTNVIAMMRTGWYVLVLFSLAISTVFYSIAAGAAASAYRSLTGYKAPETV